MKSNIKFIIGIITMVALLSACGTTSSKEKDEHGGHEEEGHGGHEEEGEKGIVSLTEQQMDAIGLKMVQIESIDICLKKQKTWIFEFIVTLSTSLLLIIFICQK